MMDMQWSQYGVIVYNDGNADTLEPEARTRARTIIITRATEPEPFLEEVSIEVHNNTVGSVITIQQLTKMNGEVIYPDGKTETKKPEPIPEPEPEPEINYVEESDIKITKKQITI